MDVFKAIPPQENSAFGLKNWVSKGGIQNYIDTYLVIFGQISTYKYSKKIIVFCK